MFYFSSVKKSDKIGMCTKNDRLYSVQNARNRDFHRLTLLLFCKLFPNVIPCVSKTTDLVKLMLTVLNVSITQKS